MKNIYKNAFNLFTDPEMGNVYRDIWDELEAVGHSNTKKTRKEIIENFVNVANDYSENGHNLMMFCPFPDIIQEVFVASVLEGLFYKQFLDENHNFDEKRYWSMALVCYRAWYKTPPEEVTADGKIFF